MTTYIVIYLMAGALLYFLANKYTVYGGDDILGIGLCIISWPYLLLFYTWLFVMCKIWERADL